MENKDLGRRQEAKEQQSTRARALLTSKRTRVRADLRSPRAQRRRGRRRRPPSPGVWGTGGCGGGAGDEGRLGRLLGRKEGKPAESNEEKG